MDIQIPTIDGYTRRIKAYPALRSIPIIAVTPHAIAGSEEKARAAGCDDFVQAPSARVSCWQRSKDTCLNTIMGPELAERSTGNTV